MGLIKNLRKGFATNSSSSHSFVYMKEAQSDSGGRAGGSDFGWEDFRLNTTAEKLFYVLTDRLHRTMQWDEDASDAAAAAMEQYGDEFPELSISDFRQAAHGYVDHESANLISPEQARDPKVVVFGGNDNGGYSQLRIEAEDEIDWAITPLSGAEHHLGTADRVKRKIRDAMFKATAVEPAAAPAPKKFHINSKGDVRPCGATKRACPFSSADHFSSRSDAEQALAERHP